MEGYFYKNLAYLRQTKGLTQSEFGEIIGKKKSVVSQYEKGESEPGIAVIKKLAKYFGLSYSDLMDKDLSTTKDPGETVKSNANSYLKELDTMGEEGLSISVIEDNATKYLRKEELWMKEIESRVDAMNKALSSGDCEQIKGMMKEATGLITDLSNRYKEQGEKYSDIYVKAHRLKEIIRDMSRIL